MSRRFAAQHITNTMIYRKVPIMTTPSTMIREYIKKQETDDRWLDQLNMFG